MAKYIPDFIQVLLELLHRNAKHTEIPCAKLRSLVDSLCKFEDLENINNTLPYLLCIYAIMRMQDEEVEFMSFFSTYMKKLTTITIEKSND